MKKILAIVVGIAGVAWLVNKARSAKADKDLWSEATDQV